MLLKIMFIEVKDKYDQFTLLNINNIVSVSRHHELHHQSVVFVQHETFRYIHTQYSYKKIKDLINRHFEKGIPE